MVGIDEYDLATGCRLRVCPIVARVKARGDPVRLAVEEHVVRHIRMLVRQSDRVLIGLRGLIALHESQHRPLPLERVRPGFVGDLEQHVVQVADGINHRLDIPALDLGHPRVPEGVELSNVLSGRHAVHVVLPV